MAGADASTNALANINVFMFASAERLVPIRKQHEEQCDRHNRGHSDPKPK